MMQATIEMIRRHADKAGETPDDYARRVMSEEFGEEGERLGDFAKENADPVECLAVLLITSMEGEKL